MATSDSPVLRSTTAFGDNAGDNWRPAATSWDPDSDGQLAERRIELGDVGAQLVQLAGVTEALLLGTAGEPERALAWALVRRVRVGLS